MRTLIGLVVLAALAPLAGGCREPDQAAPEPAGEAEMAGLLDAARTAAKAEAKGKVVWYTRANLFDYIDGQAEEFFDAGFVLLAHGEYAPVGAPAEAYAEIDVYDMGSPGGALDIFGDLRSGKTAYMPIGNEAQDAGGALELRVGRYFVRITGRRDAKALQPAMESMARAMAGAAPAGPSDGGIIAPLPADSMLSHTAAYTTKNFLGQESLARVRQAAYAGDGGPVRLFVMDAGSAEKAADAMAQWQAAAKAEPAADKDLPDSVAAKVPYVGTVIMARKGRWLAGSISEAADGRPLLKTLLGQLK